MLYQFVTGATIVFASLSVLTQIVLLPLILRHSENVKTEFQARMRQFHHNARVFDDSVNRLQKLGGIGPLGRHTDDLANSNVKQHPRFARQLHDDGGEAGGAGRLSACPPPYPGPPGPPGDNGVDGEPGDPGRDGSSGLDAYQLLLEEAQKCVECPAGPIGPMGAPGPQGFPGLKGDKGEPGTPGKDGIDGEQGAEGFVGKRGPSGNKGKKGVDGAPAPGGQGPPGPPGVKGPRGTAGAQGERGKRNYVIGSPGQDGRAGKPGMDGIEGKAGPRGEKGEKGEPGADARFCPCPMEFNMASKDKPKSHLINPLTADTKAVAFAARSQPSQASAVKPIPFANNPSAFPSPPPENRPPVNQQKLEANDAAAAKVTHGAPPPTLPVEGSRAEDIAAITSSNLAYEDAYPNYDGDGSRKRKDYDDDGETVVDGENTKVDSPLHDGGSDKEPTYRRFVYVTKRPRPGMIAN